MSLLRNMKFFLRSIVQTEGYNMKQEYSRWEKSIHVDFSYLSEDCYRKGYGERSNDPHPHFPADLWLFNL
jgi:hypothetical protein